MKFYQPKENNRFIGRKAEWKRLSKITSMDEAQIIVIYGRRRVGKTELIEQFFRKKNLLKFEGTQCDPPKSGTARVSLERKQIRQSLVRFLAYQQTPELIGHLTADTWTDFFSIITPIVEKRAITLYFEEAQWLASYGSNFFSEMKPFWDDKWRHNRNLRIVITGSSPSFLVSQFLSNKALYNRSNHIIELKPFTLPEVEEYLSGCGAREVLLAMLTVGGIPEYLKRVKSGKSLLSSIAHEFFHSEGSFRGEVDKIFVSSLSANIHYRNILSVLAQQRFLTRDELGPQRGQSEARPGGSFTRILEDMVSCHFVDEYTPVFENRKRSSKLKRYVLADEFLSFYFKLVAPVEQKIGRGAFDDNPMKALNQNSFRINLGFMFERWCCKNSRIVAKILGFDGVVDYDSGPYFNRKLSSEFPGFQIDLLFIRRDHRLVFSEIKYCDGDVPVSVSDDLSKKIELFLREKPSYRHHTIERVLITTGSFKSAGNSIGNPFDHIITLDDLFRIAHK